MQVYKFKVKLRDFENTIWRDIEVSANSTMAKLSYAVLAAFEAEGSHMFDINYNGVSYSIMFPGMDYPYGTKEARKTKLTSLKMEIGDTATLTYDYGSSWTFNLELIEISEMKRGSGNHYPYVTDGAGRGIIENIFPSDLEKIIQDTDTTGKIPEINEHPWDYRNFSLEYHQSLLKGKIYILEMNYEG
ncbi:plasmid pRiA4b ORF-3 family protein [Companilactobacillus hulinensis]|uniref:plasmid pRiA4b ORF-3 family protein n=1 Tax=Companilactobacillus hulinensis TaxID=2486007 RepID=UPI000F7B0FEA|nr:plasmid pRiA4b ORF-3 family protein [Companilactobacillus hulinensis]